MIKGLTGKAWDNTLSPTQTRIIALCSRAARSLSCTETWNTWFRSPDSFLGSELKKSLPHMKIGIISQSESDYLSSRYAASIQQYNSALQILNSPTQECLRDLGNTLKKAGQVLQPLELAVNRVIQMRVAVIYPSNKKEKKAALKRPIADLINEVDLVDYIERFDPSLLGGYKPFFVQPRNRDESPPQYCDRIRRAYEARINLIENGGHPMLSRLCQLWADEAICPLRSE